MFAKKDLQYQYLIFFSLFILLSNQVIAQSGIFVGGPAYYDRNFSINELRNSGYTFVVIWTIHVMNSDGDLNFNAEFPVVEDGQYIGDATYPEFTNDMALLKTAPTSIKRLEIGLSAWGSGTFDFIKTLVNTNGTAPGSILYENFKALKEAIPQIDAINFDDESTYDVASATKFALMLAGLDYKVTLCPYTAANFWKELAKTTNEEQPGTVDRVYLQCYSGGAYNNPCSWDMLGLPIWPGLAASSKSASSVESQLNTWQNQCGITGGWIWLYDHIKNSPNVSEYAIAINNALNIGQIPKLASHPDPANEESDISINKILKWRAGSATLSHDVYFGTVNPPGVTELIGNQVETQYTPESLSENTTYYWKVDEVNDLGTTTGEVWSFTTGENTTTSIATTNKNKNLQIYPNPFDQSLNIEARESVKSIYLLGLTGKVLYKKVIQTKEMMIVAPNLPKGVYMIKIEYENGVQEFQKIIKQ